MQSIMVSVSMSITTLTFASYQVIQKNSHAVMTQIAQYMMSLVHLYLNSANGIPLSMQLLKTFSLTLLEQTNIASSNINIGKVTKHS